MSDLVEKMNALADGELQGEEKDSALHAMASDPSAAAEYQWATLLKSQLRTKLPPVENDELWAACKERLNGLDKARRAETFVGKYAWAFCLIFLVGIFSAATINRFDRSRPLTNSHVAGLLNGLTPSSFSESSDALESVRQAVGIAPKQYPDRMHVKSLSIGTVDGRRAARLTFTDEIGDVNLYVVSSTSGVEGIEGQEGGYRCGQINDYSAVCWTEYGRLFMLVSSRSHEDLIHAADEIRNVR